jgi:hypothetical protein
LSALLEWSVVAAQVARASHGQLSRERPVAHRHRHGVRPRLHERGAAAAELFTRPLLERLWIAAPCTAPAAEAAPAAGETRRLPREALDDRTQSLFIPTGIDERVLNDQRPLAPLRLLSLLIDWSCPVSVDG